MALPPSLQALSIGPLDAPNTLELFLDYLCPFSAKQLLGVERDLLPLILGEGSQFANKVRVVIRPYPQPWHSSSTLLHESALAVAKIAITDPKVTADPARNAFWLYSLELMKRQDAFFDGPARGKSPDQVRGELATLAIETVGEGPRKRKQAPVTRELDGTPLGQSVKNLIRVEKEGNAGSAVVPELKYCVSCALKLFHSRVLSPLTLPLDQHRSSSVARMVSMSPPPFVSHLPSPLPYLLSVADIQEKSGTDSLREASRPLSPRRTGPNSSASRLLDFSQPVRFSTANVTQGHSRVCYGQGCIRIRGCICTKECEVWCSVCVLRKTGTRWAGSERATLRNHDGPEWDR